MHDRDVGRDVRLLFATEREIDREDDHRADEDARSLGYAIDFHELTSEMASLYEGVDLWICDCLRRKPHPTHAHLDAVLGWAKDLKVGQLLLTHLDKSMDYATLLAELPDWAEPAFDGQEISL